VLKKKKKRYTFTEEKKKENKVHLQWCKAPGGQRLPKKKCSIVRVNHNTELNHCTDLNHYTELNHNTELNNYTDTSMTHLHLT
jgi:hypothetical protein